MRQVFTRLIGLSILLIINLLLISSCKKEAAAPDPDMASNVMGTYAISKLTTPGSTTSTSISGTVVMVRNGTALDKVDLTLSYSTAGASGSLTFSETKTISLQRSDNAIDLYNNTTKVGSWAASTLTLTNYPFNSSTVSLTATKQ